MNDTCDKPLIYSSLGDDPDLADLVQLFVDDLSLRMAALEEAARGENWPELGRVAHQIKGASGSYGFNDLFPYARDLETVARNDPQAAHVLPVLAELLAVCRRVRSGVPAQPELRQS